MYYVILIDRKAELLQEKVNDHLKRGYRLLGELKAVQHSENVIHYLQTMTKETDEKFKN